MMEWRDEGVILSSRPHGESATIVELFTEGHGRHGGVVRGGASRRMAPVLQPGGQVHATWRARLDEHIGVFVIEGLRSRAGILSDRRALACQNAVCGLLAYALPEREPHPAIYSASIALLDRLSGSQAWEVAYLEWELLLLEDLGYGLDLSACAVTGATDDLAFVSPTSGRAVSRKAGEPWAGRLLPFPSQLPEALGEGLRTTGFFLEKRLAPDLGNRPFPAARKRLIDLLSRPA